MLISRRVYNLQSENKYMVEMALFNVQRALTPKAGKTELWFMCSACHLIELYICVKFHENITDGISYGADKNDGSTDGWRDTQNFGEYNIIPLSLFVAGHKMSSIQWLTLKHPFQPMSVTIFCEFC